MEEDEVVWNGETIGPIMATTTMKTKDERAAECEVRGFHRIMITNLKCIWCGKQLTAEQAIENEKLKFEKIDSGATSPLF